MSGLETILKSMRPRPRPPAKGRDRDRQHRDRDRDRDPENWSRDRDQSRDPSLKSSVMQIFNSNSCISSAPAHPIPLNQENCW